MGFRVQSMAVKKAKFLRNNHITASSCEKWTWSATDLLVKKKQDDGVGKGIGELSLSFRVIFAGSLTCLRLAHWDRPKSCSVLCSEY